MKKKIVALMCCIGIITSIVSGCGNNENTNQKLASTEDTETKTGDFNIKVVDASYNGIEYDYHNFSFTVMNNTDKTIHTIGIDINIMDKDRNIISTTYPQESSRLNPGQNITIEALAEKELNAYCAVVDGYSYYCGEDYVTGYVNESLEVVFDSDLKNDNMNDDTSALINKYPEEYSKTDEADYDTQHTCEVSGCYKDGIYSMVGFSGNVEYYCSEHYHEMEDMVEMMFGD